MNDKIRLEKDQKKLLGWYEKNKRPLPWRKSKDPYKIWISEMMLQQTRVQTVLPYYKKFLSRFKTPKQLALAPLEEVISYWSGLGYYSRAKYLHRSAKMIHEKKAFPRTYKELVKLPGFGPYTARAVSSLAFEERVAVVDGNVIRVLSRYLGIGSSWWKNKEKKKFQQLADDWVKKHLPSTMNQSLMELGALICKSSQAFCTLCPLKLGCYALKNHKVQQLPLKKEKKREEIWIWKPVVLEKNKQVALVKNEKVSFLKGHLIFPGTAKKQKKAPSKYDFYHSITHHKIYVSVFYRSSDFHSLKWFPIQEIKKMSPSSLIQKTLNRYFQTASE